MTARELRHAGFSLVLLWSIAAGDVPGLSFEEGSSLPNWVTSHQFKLPKPLEGDARLNPFYLTGDFDGDRHLDIALLVRNVDTDEVGIAIAHRDYTVHVLGAGIDSNDRGRDYSWMDAWSIYPRGEVFQGASEESPPKLVADAILVKKLESASALVYWDGRQYQWYQQGD